MRAVIKTPPSTIIVEDGRVVKIEKWVERSRDPLPTIVIERKSEIFRSSVCNPEHGGGGSFGGTIDKVTEGLDAQSREQYARLFALKNPTAEEIRALGFTTEQIHF